LASSCSAEAAAKRIIEPASRGAVPEVAQRRDVGRAAAQRLEEAGMATAEGPLQCADTDWAYFSRLIRRRRDESGRVCDRGKKLERPANPLLLKGGYMETIVPRSRISRRNLLSTLAALPALTGSLVAAAQAQLPQQPPARATGNGLPSWNEGPAKQAILDFVRTTTDASNPKFVPPEERIATFDQDGTLWVEHPLYSQFMYCVDRVPLLTGDRELLKPVPPFSDVLSGNRETIDKLSQLDLELVAVTTLSGMTVDEFVAEAKKWLATAKDPRWKRPYTDLTYQPMQEVLSYLRANSYKTYIVTGGGEDFVRQYSERVYGIPPTQVVGSAGGTKFGYDKDGRPFLTKDWRLLVNDNNAGKPESIHLMIGQRPYASFGNSTGDQQMLEYTGAGAGARLMMLVLHDDAQREYAYGPAQGLPDTKVGTFTPELYDEAKKKDWTVISMKNDWKRIFAFD
jgi:phosphoglycolate phosphatase-like HAD superfamily hydrolase